MKINVDFIYPIGSVYISTQPTNPSVLFGGEWVQTCRSRALAGAGSNTANTNSNYGTYAAGTLNLQAGESLGEISHKLTVAEMPAHSHAIRSGYGEGSAGSDAYRYQYWASSNLGWKTGNLGTNSIGGDGTHNNIMPIEVYYIWKRVS
jgi:microcystin-dependent protein